MRKILDTVKKLVVCDADKEFYARVFPHSVTHNNLMRLRKMHVDDLAAVLSIEANNYHFPWSEQIFKTCLDTISYSCWICEEFDEVKGYSVVSTAVDKVHIMNVCVAVNAQQQGVGTKLLDSIIETARDTADSISLEVRPSNQAAISLYKKRGFNQVGIHKDYYPTTNGYKEDAVILTLDLATLC